MDFAAQLESMSLWQWSVFVLLHLENPQKRSKLVRDCLSRNVIPSDEESSEKEVFLQDRLGIPLKWIAAAKAVRSFTDNNYGDQVIFFFLIFLSFFTLFDNTQNVAFEFLNFGIFYRFLSY